MVEQQLKEEVEDLKEQITKLQVSGVAGRVALVFEGPPSQFSAIRGRHFTKKTLDIFKY